MTDTHNDQKGTVELNSSYGFHKSFHLHTHEAFTVVSKNTIHMDFIWGYLEILVAQISFKSTAWKYLGFPRSVK